MNKKILWFLIALVIAIGIIAVILIYRSRPVPEPAGQIPVDEQKEVVYKEVTLFMSDTDAMYLVPVKVAVQDTAGLPAFVSEIVRKLSEPIADSDIVPSIPEGTKLLRVYPYGKQLILDFSKEIVDNHPGGTSAEMMTIYSIVNTMLYNLPDFDSVYITVGGMPRETLAGHIDISEPIYFNKGLIRPAPAPDTGTTQFSE